MSTAASDDEHQKILEEVITDKDKLPKPRNMLPYYLGAVILIMLLALWAFPSDSLPVRPKRNDIPAISDVLPASLAVPERPTSNDIDQYVTHDHPDIKAVAAGIVTSACSKADDRCYADALHYFVQENIAYVKDPINEYYELPQETLLAGAADCDGHAILLASLMRSVGILTRFKHTPRHVSVEAWLPQSKLFSKPYAKEWVLYDATCKECGPGEARALP
ncbi:transglutaminase domain-containing protein [Candidatus Woesearchaeota archaeon]|nr:transglutaminase domain-containing protein [Candidatus Woesearchaeota archaeon]